MSLDSICIIFVYLLPVDQVPKMINVATPFILIIEIISVLPNIKPENGSKPIHIRTILVRCCYHFEITAVSYAQPTPTGTKLSACRTAELFFKIGKAAKLFIDSFCNIAIRFSSAIRGKDGPEQLVISIATAIINYILTNAFGNFRNSLKYLFNRKVFKITSFQCCIHLVSIALMVLCVMDLHCAFINMRFKRIIIIR